MAKKSDFGGAKSANAALVRAGYYHGKRKSVGLSNIPSLSDVGSAAYRRRKKIT